MILDQLGRVYESPFQGASMFKMLGNLKNVVCFASGNNNHVFLSSSNVLFCVSENDVSCQIKIDNDIKIVQIQNENLTDTVCCLAR